MNFLKSILLGYSLFNSVRLRRPALVNHPVYPEFIRVSLYNLSVITNKNFHVFSLDYLITFPKNSSRIKTKLYFPLIPFQPGNALGWSSKLFRSSLTRTLKRFSPPSATVYPFLFKFPVCYKGVALFLSLNKQCGKRSRRILSISNLKQD